MSTAWAKIILPHPPGQDDGYAGTLKNKRDPNEYGELARTTHSYESIKTRNPKFCVFRSTVGPKRSVTVEAKRVYGMGENNSSPPPRRRTTGTLAR